MQEVRHLIVEGREHEVRDDGLERGLPPRRVRAEAVGGVARRLSWKRRNNKAAQRCSSRWGTVR